MPRLVHEPVPEHPSESWSLSMVIFSIVNRAPQLASGHKQLGSEG